MKSTPYRDRTRAELLAEKEQVQTRYEELKGRGLKLDMSRGKPGAQDAGQDDHGN